MIKNIFPISIFTKDWNLPENYSNDLRKEIKFLHDANLVNKNHKNIEKMYFREELLSEFNNLNKLYEMFRDGIYELSLEYGNDDLPGIEERLKNSDGKLFSMSDREYFSYHRHYHSTVFGIFYLEDFDNSNGGELTLVDPVSNNMGEFRGNYEYKIETKKHRMIICPSYIGHSVTPINSKNKREHFVIDLNLPLLPTYKMWNNIVD